MPPRRNHVTLADFACSTGLGPTFQDGRRVGGIVDVISAEPVVTTVITASLRQVAPHPDNPCSHLGDLTDMAETIAAGGLIHPLVVMTAAAWRVANPDRAGDIDPRPGGSSWPATGAEQQRKSPAARSSPSWSATTSAWVRAPT